MSRTTSAQDGGRWLAEAVLAEYSDTTRLAIRENLYRWEQPRLDLHGRVAKRVAGCTRLILDVGCGTGRSLERLYAAPGRPPPRRRGRFAAMLKVARAAGADGRLIAGDAAALPFPDDVASAVLTVHLLYLVPDPAAELAEMARVLGPDGLLVVVTTGEDDKVLVAGLLSDALGELMPRPDVDRRGPDFRRW